MKILIQSVGGSYQPLLKAIEQNRPDFIHFICSAGDSQKGSHHQITGKGKVLCSPSSTSPDLPNLATLASLNPAQFKVHLTTAPDDLESCFNLALQIISDIRKDVERGDTIVDYTGGTKSMSAGLAAAALHDGKCKFQIISGHRNDLRQVRDGTESVRSVNTSGIHLRRALDQSLQLLQRYDYAGAADLLEQTGAQHPPGKLEPEWQKRLALSRAFDAWDRFEHGKALDLLKPYKEEFKDHTAHLGVYLSKNTAREWMLVEDLLLNADRRAAQDRWDDAAGRLYRALEMTAQIWLKERHHLDTSSPVPDTIPETHRERIYRQNMEGDLIKISLRQAWELLDAWPDDPLRRLFQSEGDSVLGFLEIRNKSLLAHGKVPVSKRDFDRFRDFANRFLPACIQSALGTLGIHRRSKPLIQFPTAF